MKKLKSVNPVMTKAVTPPCSISGTQRAKEGAEEDFLEEGSDNETELLTTMAQNRRKN